VDVSPASYPAFDAQKSAESLSGRSLDIVADIPLQVSVELGKTKKTISDIMEFGIGTIVVLDKIAGEHVEVLANGKLIAAGEVVVIDENYGVRITDIFE
jgi:flagellar motor switch protein FliN/FliY